MRNLYTVFYSCCTNLYFYQQCPRISFLHILTCCCCRCIASVVSDSVRPHGLQPTRLLHPWDSPGKNTGVGCHFLLQSMKVESESEVIQSCPTLRDPMDCSLPGSSIHGNSTGVGCHCLLAHPHQYFLFLVFWITPF